ncbi:MAG: NAD-dependent epimerase/dehydratase family protein [Promethearchaeota archaeon]|jgi:nucleoside-diphosphate-sugar epimerase
MKIFVTGGSGFIGRHLVSLLATRGHEILVVTRSEKTVKENNFKMARYLRMDLRDSSILSAALKEFEPQTLVHLAWEGLPDYSEKMCRRNLDYGIDIFSRAAEVGCTCILSTGSCWEYAGRNGMFAEDDRVESTSMFPAVKNALRFVGEAIANKNIGRFYWLRLFFVFGPGQRIETLIPHIIQSVSKNIIPQIKTPLNRNDFIYVKDVARAIADVLEMQPKNSVYNVGSGYSTSIEDIVHTTYEVLGKPYPQESFVKKGAGAEQDFWADISRIKCDIGWQPEYDIESGIKETIKSLSGGE